MIFLALCSSRFYRVRAVTASTFFLSITPAKTVCFEPVTLSTGVYIALLAAIYGTGELLSYGIIAAISSPTQTTPCYDPTCTQCIQERAAQQKRSSLTSSMQAPETQGSQVIINNTTHTTTITAAEGNTIFVTQPKATPAPNSLQPVQTVQTVQQMQPEKSVVENNQSLIKVPLSQKLSSVDSASLAALNGRMYERFQLLYQQHYGKAALALVATGYLYSLYSILSLQQYLTDSKRVSLWFSEYELNRLLALEFDQMQELILQEFISRYGVSDQKSLKAAIADFLDESEQERARLEYYQSLAGYIDTLSSVVENAFLPCTALARMVVPFAGFVLDTMPSITVNRLLCLNTFLKNGAQERIARIDYYRNIFLQSTIII